MAAELTALRNALASRDDVRLAVVFGSHARAEATAESDVDLAIRGGADRFRLAAELSEALGREVDVVPLDTDDLVLLNEIVRDGRLVIEREPGAFARFRSHALATLETDLPGLRHQQAAFTARLASAGIPGVGSER